jgi:hypothetical protein
MSCKKVAQFVKHERDGKTQYDVDGGDVHLKLLTVEEMSGFCFHLINAIEGCLPGVAKDFAVLNSSAEWMRQWGWRLKFPGTLLTVPEIGWSQ